MDDQSPSSVLRCHRHRLVPLLLGAGLPFPRTIVDSPRVLHGAADSLEGEYLWVKRGDVHAQEPADVVRIDRGHLAEALRAFGIAASGRWQSRSMPRDAS